MQLTMTKGKEDGVPVQMNFPVIYEPDQILVGRAENVVVPVRSEIEQTVFLEVEMPSLLETYTFEVLDIQGAENISSIACYITGQAPLRYMWDMRFPSSASAITFDVPLDRENGVIKTVFNTFGKHPFSTSDVYLNILISSASGGLYQWVYDVTDQFDNPDNVGHRIVVSESLVVPDAAVGGFTPSVSDWQAEITPVPLQ